MEEEMTTFITKTTTKGSYIMAEKEVKEVPGPDTEPNQKDEDDKDGQLVTPPASAPDGPTTDEPAGDPSINPTTPPPAPTPEQP